MNDEWEPLASTLFTRHDIHLHALLFENQAWFCARDIGRLMGKYLDERMSRKLDTDQRRMLLVHAHGVAEERLMLSESGVYALLVYHYCPEYRKRPPNTPCVIKRAPTCAATARFSHSHAASAGV
jgi:prophage antirepressor-like protein